MASPDLLAAAGGAALGAAAGYAVRRFVWRLVSMNPPPIRLPWIEALGLLLFAACAALRVAPAPAPGEGVLYGGATGLAAAYLLARDVAFLVLLLALSVVDLVYKYLPDEITYTGMFAGAALALIPQTRGDAFLLALVGMAVGYAAVWLLRAFFNLVTGLEVMGLGDVKLMGMTGAFLGPWGALWAFVSAMFVGCILGVGSRLVTGKPHFALGPSLAVGSVMALLVQDRLGAWLAAYLEWVQGLPRSAVLGASLVGLAVAVALLVRIRRRAAEYEKQIEEDYDEIDRRAGGPTE